ncbi:unnamed protein product [Phyllotreta striolata]|uniref:Gamma-tubulin complex component n=1 Tax=Phyllotreta striolata TaxID=444603 RepID=A0A9N9TGU8_PHYSR|nr:unnamed protein product [Phyllotreta striolata]
MARPLSSDISEGLKELIINITGYKEGSSRFNSTQKQIHEKLRKSDTMYFLNKTEVDRSIAGMAEKFQFHGFFSQANVLLEAYKGYITENISGSELISHLNVVKFLLCMSERPTYKFLDRFQDFEVKKQIEEEEIDWGEYLKEGIEYTVPSIDNESDISDSSSIHDEIDTQEDIEIHKTFKDKPTIIDEYERDVIVNLRANREELFNTIQHTWYNTQHFHDAPVSDRREGNIGIMWDSFLEKQTMGLIDINKKTVISEYKVLREILWQLWDMHASSVFYWKRNHLEIRDNVTISSTRAINFQDFLHNQIMPYIKLLDFFKEFSSSLLIKDELSTTGIPQTYKSYTNGIRNLIKPIYKELSKLENKIREQETTYTLLNLTCDLRAILEPLVLVKKIHDYATIDINNQSNIVCVCSLLARLHLSLRYSSNKLDQDLKITLYIETLYYYLTVIDMWLMKNDLTDYTQEFLIFNNNTNRVRNSLSDSISSAMNDHYNLNFDVVEEIDEKIKEDGILKIITTSVIQIGRNLHFLRLLGDYSVIQEQKETIFEEFVRKTLEELCTIFGQDPKDVTFDEQDISEDNATPKTPIICPDDCNKLNEMDNLENLVDTSDGFLMLAFRDFLKPPNKITKPDKCSLYDKISKITKTSFLITNFFEKILNDILKQRFAVSCIRVKNLLIEHHMLEKKFQFLRHVYMFADNIIFEFYRRFFEKVNAGNKNWGNDLWLTSHLQDIIMDIYPEFYDRCLVVVRKNWTNCGDSLEACDTISIKMDIKWPLNIIITDAQMSVYRETFDFILKIKWALYTLNHLSFSDLSPKDPSKKHKCRANAYINTRLMYLRFALINLLNGIHHYLFSFVFAKCVRKFELDFEKANDLFSIVSSHADFVAEIGKLAREIRRCGRKGTAFDGVTKCIVQLKSMWENINTVTPLKLYEIYRNYRVSFDAINPIISPQYLFDF